jgi:DNA-binding NtrC family response regulator
MAGRVLVSERSIEIVGHSAATARLREQIERVAPFASNVLITGPSGTGKELVARQIHTLSPRLGHPFVPVDCAAMTGELMSSQLFGHVAGAFTGANCDALGCFRAAHGGTIFLDEIGELEYLLQSKLLRVLQERTVTPVGSHQGQPVDVRVIAATNRDLRAEVAAGRFREDLFYRLHVVHVQMTPLRDRPGDIPELAESFLSQLAAEGLPRCELSPNALRELIQYSWPGNIRQLRNVLEQAVIESDAKVLEARHIARLLEGDAAETSETSCEESEVEPAWREPPAASACQVVEPPALPGWMTLASIEREHLQRTLEHTFFNRSAAARLLGITRQALLRKIERHGIEIPDSLS